MEESKAADQGLSPARIEALADGLFAIVMTLMIFDLKVPRLPAGATGSQLWRNLVPLWPQVVCYLMSFISLGTLWVAHHFEFHYIVRVDRTLLWINIVFFIFVTAIPFLTSLLGQYPSYSLPAVLYGANLIVAGGCLFWIWHYATTGRRLVSPGLTEAAVRAGKRRTLFGSMMYLIAVALAFVNGWISIAIYALVPIAYTLPGRIDRHVLPRPEDQ